MTDKELENEGNLPSDKYLQMRTAYIAGAKENRVVWQETAPPEVLCKEKLEAIETAEKDLQKFLINCPQFKE